jgi:hypothetical protein
MDWREYKPDDASFSATFPQKPGMAQRVLPLQPEPVTMHMLVAQAQGATYGVGVVQFKAGLPASLLPLFRDALSRSVGGKVEREAPVEGGTQFYVRSDTHLMRAKLITMAGPPARLYQVAWVAPLADGQNADHDLFFSSFRPR